MKSSDPLETEETDFSLSDYQGDDTPWSRYLVYLIAVILIACVLWAAFFELDEVAVASGKVIPASRGQVVQILDAGILRDMNVREGQHVKRGDVLLQLNDSRVGPVYREAFEKWRSLSAQVSRLRAEAYDLPLKFSLEVHESDQLVERETQAFRARKNALDDQLIALEKSRTSLNREIKLTAPLVKKGVVSEVELLQLQRQDSGLEGQIAELKTRYLSTANNELVRADSDFNEASEILMAYKDALQRTTVKAPTDGIVKDIRVSTIGAVIGSGQVIMEIVPIDDEMLVEAFVSPAEVAYVKIGQTARVKLSAFDSQRYGELDGVVKLISADVSIEDSKGGSSQDAAPVNFEPGFYKLLITITNPGVERKGMKMTPKPGMTATVDILTGQKTVLEYVFRPFQTLQEALRER